VSVDVVEPAYLVHRRGFESFCYELRGRQVFRGTGAVRFTATLGSDWRFFIQARSLRHVAQRLAMTLADLNRSFLYARVGEDAARRLRRLYLDAVGDVV